jgi:uncharacterized membrane protein
VNANTSNVMGVALLVFGTALAVTVGASGDRNALVLGFIGAAALFYMGIGLYSRGNTETGLLRASGEETKRTTLYRTSSYVAAAASVGAFGGFALATLAGESLAVRLLFAVVFLYTLPVSVRLRRMSTDVDVDVDADAETETEPEEAGAT